MPPQVQLKSKPDEKDIELLDYSGAINQLNVVAKKELEDTKNQIILANTQLAMLKQNITNQTTEFERWKRAETLRHTNELTQIKNDIIAKQNSINMHCQQQERITADLQTQHVKFESLNSDRIKFKEELVKLEGKKIELADMAKQIESQRSAVLSSQNQGAMALAKAEEEAEKNKQENIRLVQLNDQLEKRARKVEEDEKNLSSLKEFVEPKLRAIKDEQESLDRAKIENNETIAKLQQTMQDEKILLQSVLDKKAQLEKETKDLLSQKEEFLRTKTLSGN